MDRFTIDKRVTAALSAVLLLVAANAFVDMIYPTGRNAPRLQASLEPGASEPSVLELLASADPAKGEKLAKKCEICHTLKERGASKVGPELYGVVGRKVASVQGFAYSRALKAKGGEWTYDKLDSWIQNPHEDLPDSKMTFTGMFTPQDRAHLIAFLRALSDNPAPLPGAAAMQPKSMQPEPMSSPPEQKPAAPAPGPTGSLEPRTPNSGEANFGQAMEKPEGAIAVIVEDAASAAPGARERKESGQRHSRDLWPGE
jgi:cytochrome c